MVYELVHVATEQDWQSYHRIRRDVLWTARGRTTYDDRHPDEHRSGHYPLLLKCDGVPVGTTRLDVRAGDVGIVRLVAVPESEQGRGHGRHLSALVEAQARALGLTTLYVNAVATAVDYYRKTGWEPFAWDASELKAMFAAGIQMRKLLR